MSLAAAIGRADEHLNGEPGEDARVVQLRHWLARARSRAAVLVDEARYALAEADRVAAALEVAERDLRGDQLQ